MNISVTVVTIGLVIFPSVGRGGIGFCISMCSGVSKLAVISIRLLLAVNWWADWLNVSIGIVTGPVPAIGIELLAGVGVNIMKTASTFIIILASPENTLLFGW